jgi:glycosyltransferase involved in cell wall biosynthesis
MKVLASGYNGPHKIILNRNAHNLGLAGNINHAFELSAGQFIVIQAGDDISVPERVEKLVQRWQDPTAHVDLVCSYFEEIDINGKPTGYIERNVVFVPDKNKQISKWRCGATGACAAYSRILYEKYGPLDMRVFSEDWVYSFRAWLESGIAVVEEPLVKHRTHSIALSVIHQNINAVQDEPLRWRHRRKNAENSLGIAEEWLRAWKISGNKDDIRINTDLHHLVKIRHMQLLAHDSTRAAAFKLAILLLFNRGGLVNTARILVRHVLRCG